ncbi:hypothetical protein KEM48_005339 [Puccinia striiformis f. sp. tritici PST-130]|nr:hypothetical protein KEM48_005339 [Puccinia striiformis f. sp. tritici PST-130]
MCIVGESMRMEVVGWGKLIMYYHPRLPMPSARLTARSTAGFPIGLLHQLKPRTHFFPPLTRCCELKTLSKN